jgi:nickel/cobalt transporter (NicO) family protein
VLRAMLLGAAAAIPLALLPAGAASAHPLDVYLQGSYVTLAPSAVEVELDLSPGVLVAPRALAALDPDGDRTISSTESGTYAAGVLRQVEVRVDGRALPLRLTGVEVPPYLTVQTGYGTIKVRGEASGAPSAAGRHQVAYRNRFAPAGSAYQVNAFVAAGAAVVLGTQHRDATQRQSVIDYRIGSAGPAPAQPTAEPARSGGGALLGYLEGPSLSLWAMLLAVGAAAGLGALHALTPGHAKTLMAAYLVGSGGTTRNALALGAIVTFTHTASVIVIGLVALLASQFLLPGVLVPALEIIAGLLVLALGVRLLRRRGPSRGAGPVHDHAREHVLSGAGHGHHHDPAEPHVHSHGGRPHTHSLPAEGITPRGLLAMGVSGGLVPCPEALGVMILAVGVNRTVLGLGLIVSFSVGLAAVLMGLGLLLVRSRGLIARFDRVDGRWLAALPIVSAVVVTILGLALILKGAGADLPL